MEDDPGIPIIRDEDQHPELEAWADNCGAPVALDVAPRSTGPIAGLDILCWNLAIGEAELERLVDRLREEPAGDVGRDAGRRPFVILAQEAYREGGSVPEAPRSGFHGGKEAGRRRTDIVELARRLGLSLRYAPSMRNGGHRSDRGNAILADRALDAAAALKLPHVRQRRVALVARLAELPELALVSAHVDTHGRPKHGRGRWGFASGRAAQARRLADRLRERHPGEDTILGADLNSPLGARDPAVRALREGGFEHPRRVGGWRSTYAGRLPLLLDHVLYRPGGRIADVTVDRLDDPDGRAGRAFGSDHHPLLARVELA